MAGRAIYYYREKTDHTVCLLKAFGEAAAVEIPREIGGMPVTEIGSYCFAAGRGLPAGEVSVDIQQPEKTVGGGMLLPEAVPEAKAGDRAFLPEAAFETEAGDEESLPEMAAEVKMRNRLSELDFTAIRESLHEWSGGYIESVVLPDTVTKLDTCAFYHCTNLTVLSVAGTLAACGSDVFVNCGRLHQLIYRNPVGEPGGLKVLLSQISWDVEVSFGAEPPEAVVYYPEYTEGYDEIGPAHMFEIYIHGEGYRARQSFREDRIYFPGYDGIFPQACVEESPATLSRMAWDRLAFPAELSSGCRTVYEQYIRENQRFVSEWLLQDPQMSWERRRHVLETLIRTHCLDRSTVDGMIRQAAADSQAELSASLIVWKNRYCQAEKKSRYSFDAF